MGHYDNCRPGYCGKCGAGPGNMIDGQCEFCYPVAGRVDRKKDADDLSIFFAGKEAEVNKSLQELAQKGGTRLLCSQCGVFKEGCAKPDCPCRPKLSQDKVLEVLKRSERKPTAAAVNLYIDTELGTYSIQVGKRTVVQDKKGSEEEATAAGELALQTLRARSPNATMKTWRT